MRKKTIVLAAAGLAAIGLAAAAVPGAAHEGWRGGGEHGWRGSGGHSTGMIHRMGRRGGHMAFAMYLFETYDTDGDGRITREEIDAVRTDRFTRFNADGSEGLSLEEFEGLWLEQRRPRMVRAFQRFDRDGDGVVTVEEFERPVARMMLMLDRNRDGALSLEDRGRGRGMRGMRGDDIPTMAPDVAPDDDDEEDTAQ